MKRVWLIALILLLTTISAACGQESSNNAGPSYKEIKSMVVDILKTEEGQKAIQEAAFQHQDSENSRLIQMLSSPQGQQIQLAVKDVMTDPSFHKHLQTIMTDPRFAGEFAKAVQKEDEHIHKSLLKDPEYQTMLIEVFNNQEFKEIMFEVMKSKDYRKQTMMVMQEALQDPIFKLEMLELIKTAVKESSEPNFEKAGTEDSKGKEDKQKEGQKKEEEKKKEESSEGND